MDTLDFHFFFFSSTERFGISIAGMDTASTFMLP